MDIQTQLTAGEVSRWAAARFDRDFYAASAERVQNMFVRIEGGVTRRSGFEHVALAKTPTEIIRLLRFKRANDDVVVIEAGDQYFRFHDALTLAPLASPDVVTPYTTDKLDAIYAWQSANVMVFTAKTGDVEPQLLIRFADDDWELRTYPSVLGPFQGRNAENGFNISSSNDTGTVTLTATNGQPFKAGMEGGLFRLFTPFSGQPFETWTAEEDPLASGNERLSGGRVYAASGSGAGSRTPPVHEAGTVADGGGNISWTYLHDLAGVVQITTVNTSVSATGTVVERLPQSGPTSSWAEGHFSDFRGWPYVGCFFGSRLWYAGSPSFPDTVWGSRIDGFNLTGVDFKQSQGGGEVNDDHAVVRTLNDTEVNRIAWMVPGEQIIVGHAGGIVRITGPSINEPITPAGASAVRPDRPPGARFEFNGFRASGSIVYASTSGASIISLDPENFTYTDLSALSAHIGAKPFREGAFMKEPFSRLILRRDDNKCYPCTFDAQQSIIAWSSLVPGGSYNDGAAEVLSVVVAPGDDGRDMIWAAIRRTINGADQVSIERMEVDFDGEARELDQARMADAHVYVDQWTRDGVKFRVTAVGGQDAAVRDSEVTLTATGRTFVAGDVGQEIRMRPYVAPTRDLGARRDVRATITAVNGATATATLIMDCVEALYDVDLNEWGFAVSSVTAAHLVGESVGILADGYEHEDAVVPMGGVVALSGSAMRVCVGLKVPYSVLTNDLVIINRSGVTKGSYIQPGEVMLEYIDAGAHDAQLRTVSDGEILGLAEVIVTRTAADPVSSAVPLKRNVVKMSPESSSSLRSQLEIFGNGMMPMTLLAMGVNGR